MNLSALIAKLKDEPVIVIAVIVAGLISAGLITLEQVSAFFVTVSAVIVILGGFLARQKVTPTRKR